MKAYQIVVATLLFLGLSSTFGSKRADAEQLYASLSAGSSIPTDKNFKDNYGAKVSAAVGLEARNASIEAFISNVLGPDPNKVLNWRTGINIDYTFGFPENQTRLYLGGKIFAQPLSNKMRPIETESALVKALSSFTVGGALLAGVRTKVAPNVEIYSEAEAAYASPVIYNPSMSGSLGDVTVSTGVKFNF